MTEIHDRKRYPVHGGDIYRNRVTLDFSVNVNPCGFPDEIRQALLTAVEAGGRYPDMEAEKLKAAVGNWLSVSPGHLLFGNGASELFMAVFHALRPEETVIPVPAFSGYEYAARAAGSRIRFSAAEGKNGFRPGDELFRALTPDVRLLCLANPNNPTGALLEEAYLVSLLEHCRRQRITVLLDECFVEFCEGNPSMLKNLERFPDLILVRAFTKSFAIPGVRLGYLVCENKALLEKIGRQLPEWNLSCFAQAAGRACARCQDFIEETAARVRNDRKMLEEGLKQLGLRTFPGQANFILLFSRFPLYRLLLERGILIRDCSSFRGLGEGFCRIAVKTEAENRILLQTIGEILESAST